MEEDSSETNIIHPETSQIDTITVEDNDGGCIDEEEMNTNNNKTFEAFHNDNHHDNQFFEKSKDEFLFDNRKHDTDCFGEIENNIDHENKEKMFSIQKTDHIIQMMPLDKDVNADNYNNISIENPEEQVNEEPFSSNDFCSHNVSLDVTKMKVAYRQEKEETDDTNLFTESNDLVYQDYVDLAENQVFENPDLIDKEVEETQNKDCKNILQENSFQDCDELLLKNSSDVEGEPGEQNCINDQVSLRESDNHDSTHLKIIQENNTNENFKEAEKCFENRDIVSINPSESLEKSKENSENVNTIALFEQNQASLIDINYSHLDQTNLSDSLTVVSSFASDNFSSITNTCFSQSSTNTISNHETSVSTINTITITCCISTSTTATTTFILTTFSTTTLSTGSSLKSPSSKTTELLSTQVLTIPTSRLSSTIPTTSITSPINCLKGKYMKYEDCLKGRSLIPIRKHSLTSSIPTSNATTINSSKPTTKSVTVTLIPMPKTRRLSKETTLSSILKKYSSFKSDDPNDLENGLEIKNDSESNDKTIVYSNTAYEINREVDSDYKSNDTVNNRNIVEQSQIDNHKSSKLNQNFPYLTRSKNSQNLNFCLNAPSNKHVDCEKFRNKLKTYQYTKNEIGIDNVVKDQNNVALTTCLDNKHRRKDDHGSMIPSLKASFFYDKNRLDESKNKLQIYFLKSKIPTLTKTIKDQVYRNNQLVSDYSNKKNPKYFKADPTKIQSKTNQLDKNKIKNGNTKNKSFMIEKPSTRNSHKKLEETSSDNEYEESNQEFNTQNENRKLSASSESSSTSSCYDDASNELSNLINCEKNKKLNKNKNSKRSSSINYMNNSLTSGYVSDDDNEVYHITSSIPKTNESLKNKRLKMTRSSSVDEKKKHQNVVDAGIRYVGENKEKLETFEDWQNKMQSFRKEFQESTNSISTSSSSTGCWTDFDKIPFKDDETLPIEEIPVVNKKLERLFEVYKNIENRKKEKADKIRKNLSKKESPIKSSQPNKSYNPIQGTKPFEKTQIINYASNKMKFKDTTAKTSHRIPDVPKPPLSETRQRLKEYNNLFKQRQKRLFESLKSNKNQLQSTGSQSTSNEFSKSRPIGSNTKSKLNSSKPLKNVGTELKNKPLLEYSYNKIKSKNNFQTTQKPSSLPVVINKMNNFHSPRIRSFESQKRLNEIMEIGNQLKGISKQHKTLKDAKYCVTNTFVSKPRNFHEQIDNNRQMNFEKQLKSRVNKNSYSSIIEVRPTKSKSLSGYGSMGLVGTNAFKNTQHTNEEKNYNRFPNAYSSIKSRYLSINLKKNDEDKKIEKIQKDSKLSDKKQLIRPPWKYFTRG